MFWSGGLPTGGITDLFVSQRDKVKFLDVTDTLPKLQEINPIYEQGVIPASTYQTPADVPTVVVPNLLSGQRRYGRQHRLRADQGAVRPEAAELVKVNKAARHQAGHRKPDQPGATTSRRQESARRTRRGELTGSERVTDRPGPVGDVAASAAYEDEKPARQLTGWVHHLVTAGCVLVGLFALYQVFFPLAQGNQVSLILFLAAVLPLTLVVLSIGHSSAATQWRTTGATAEPDDRSTGLSPCSRWWLASIRCFRSKSATAEEDSTNS